MGDHMHLNREKATIAYKQMLKEEGAIEISVEFVKVMSTSNRWEDRFGALMISQQMVENTQGNEEFIGVFLFKHFASAFTDEESRVRNQVGHLFKAIIERDQAGFGVTHFDALKVMLLKNIEDTFERSVEVDASGVLIKPDPDSGKTRHDAEGWKTLETSMRILQNIIEGIGTRLYMFDLEPILKVILRSVNHLNRFVREISYLVTNAIFQTSAGILQKNETEEDKEIIVRFKDFCEKLVLVVSQGLGDNWSQVRYAASLCSRSLYSVISSDEALLAKYNPSLVPRMCLNRYYVAEGVRVYSIETWRLTFGEKGRQTVCDYADQICQYYISQSEADNHAVREAACHCISELCTKVCSEEAPKEVFRPHIDALLTALLDCFKDESWPVRDAACVACGFFVATFPKESESMFAELVEIWFAHLSDNIFSVRHHSAFALASIFKQAPMYQEILMERFTSHISTNIMKAKTDQQAASTKNSNLEDKTTFGVAQPFDTQHDNKQMYSCGSLAPKLKRGGGCMDHGF